MFADATTVRAATSSSPNMTAAVAKGYNYYLIDTMK